MCGFYFLYESEETLSKQKCVNHTYNLSASEAGEMAQVLKTLAALLEDLD